MGIKSKEKKQHQQHYFKEWREFLGITQERAMDRLGWSQSKISRVENCKTAVTVDDLYAAAEAYGRTTFELLSVNPSKEREVVDITALLAKANPEQRKEVANYAEFVIRGRKSE